VILFHVTLFTFQSNNINSKYIIMESQTTKNQYDVVIKRFTNSFVDVTLINRDDDSDTATTKFRKDSIQTGPLYKKIADALRTEEVEISENGMLLPNTTLTGQIIIAVV
jgi:hypothetical protein